LESRAVVAELNRGGGVFFFGDGPVGQLALPSDDGPGLCTICVVPLLLLRELGDQEVICVAGVLPAIGRGCIRGLEVRLDTFLGCGVGGVGRGWGLLAGGRRGEVLLAVAAGAGGEGESEEGGHRDRGECSLS